MSKRLQVAAWVCGLGLVAFVCGVVGVWTSQEVHDIFMAFWPLIRCVSFCLFVAAGYYLGREEGRKEVRK